MIVTVDTKLLYQTILIIITVFTVKSENVDLCDDELLGSSDCNDSLNKGSRIYMSNSHFNASHTDIDDLLLKTVSKVIGSHMRSIVNEELGVTAMQSIFDNLLFVPASKIDDEEVKKISDKIGSKIHRYTLMLEKLKVAVEESFLNHLVNPVSLIYPCCKVPKENFEFSLHFGSKVAMQTSCDLVPPNFSETSFTPAKNLTKVFIENLQVSPSIKWQYFISSDRLVTQYPATLINQDGTCVVPDEFKRFHSYEATVYSKKKLIIVMIDHGSSSTLNQLYMSKSIGKYIVSLATPLDHIGVFSVSSEILYPGGSKCLTSNVPPATDTIKFHFHTFIDRLTIAESQTNHTVAFEAVLRLITSAKPDDYEGGVLLYYISRGLLTSLSDGAAVLSTIARHRESTNLMLIINTFTVLDEGKPVKYKAHFLKDIAEQNYSKYKIEFTGVIVKGRNLVINNIDDIPHVLGDIFSPTTPDMRKVPQFSLPRWDNIGKGLVISITRSCFHKEDIIGVVGLDIHLADIVEDLTYLAYNKYQYGFLVDHNGNTLSHPSFGRPSLAIDQPILTDIRHLETSHEFVDIRDQILNLPEGRARMKQQNKTKQYLWHRVVSTPYILCIVLLYEHNPQKVLKATHSPLDVMYHRIDFLTNTKGRHICQHFQQVASMDTSGLFLSASAFISPFEYLMHKPTSLTIQSYMAYINDTTKLIANPGLKDNVRSEAVTISHITNHWKTQFLHSRLVEFIIRRYIATPTGVFLTYPAFVVDQLFEPTKRPWYLRAAIEYPGKVVVTAPYLDSTGAGYIVTVSHTVYEGRSAALHSNNDSVVAVMGIDFTMGYFLNLLYEYLPECSQKSVKCFLFDDKGYLVAHPDLSISGPVEWQHITHLEPLVANGLLNHQGLIQKIMCNSFSDRTVQRLYQFNISIDGVLTNLLHGKHCSKYYISAVPGTNLFIGIVNKTCEAVTAFCPCSLVDRLCLNCNKMEQSECECPCECPLEMDYCTGDLLDEELDSDACPSGTDAGSSYFQDLEVLSKLPPCLHVSCDNRNTRSQCLGVLGCQWCVVESDGMTPLKTPSCLRQSQCFGGVFGGPSPYGDASINVLPAETLLTMRSTPVGPAAGGFMACFIIIALGVYCYRHHASRGTHTYLSSTPGSGIRMAQFQNEADDLDCHDDQSYGHNNVLLVQMENNPPISPYRMNTSYRRPPGAESDHGYSTMTPHEDSEHLPYIEPLIREGEQSSAFKPTVTSPMPSSPSDQMGDTPSTGIARPAIFELTSCPEALIAPPMTTLPPPHFLAPVEVHIVDSH